jgi:uncharacterized protein (TIGR03083 family)
MTKPTPLDTRDLFRPVSRTLVVLLGDLQPDDWQRRTVAGAWVVRDVVAHLLDTTLRRLSFHRDGMPPPPPSGPLSSDQDLLRFVNELNATWITAAKRFSPRVLTDLYEQASSDLADWVESQPMEAPALFAVSWAGEQTSPGWFDIAREFTELWHHQQQIRMAVNAAASDDPRFLAAVISTAMRALPHAYRDAAGAPGDSVHFDVRGPSGGQWTLTREERRWTLWLGKSEAATTRIRVNDDDAWKVLFNALSPADAAKALQVEGKHDLAVPFQRARAVIV